MCVCSPREDLATYAKGSVMHGEIRVVLKTTEVLHASLTTEQLPSPSLGGRAHNFPRS